MPDRIPLFRSGGLVSEFGAADKILRRYLSDVTLTGVVESLLPDLVKNGAAGTVTLPSVRVQAFNSDNFFGDSERYTTAETTLTVPAGAQYFVTFVLAGDGSHSIQLLSDRAQLNMSNRIPLYAVSRIGTAIHSIGFDTMGGGLPQKNEIALLNTTPYRRSTGGGLILSEDGSRHVLVSTSVVYAGTTPVSILPFTSVSDTFIECYHASGVWNYSTVSVYDNSNIDNGTNKVAMTGTKWKAVWFYRSIGDDKAVYYVNGTAEYPTEVKAQAAPEPAMPAELAWHLLLVGRIIIQAGASSGDPQSAFAQTFSSAPIYEHNALSGIQGGALGDYQHLTTAQVASFTAKESGLGNPSTNGWLLASTTAGVRSWVAPYALPTASASVLGGMKIGTGLSIASGVLSVSYGTAAGTACLGNDSRLSDARVPTAHTHPASDISGLTGWATKAFTNGSTSDVAEGTNQYFTPGRVLPVNLMGFTVGINEPLAASHTILAAFGAVQGQLNARLTTVTSDATSRAANTVYVAPNGSAGSATFRSLAPADIPNLDAAKLTSGTLGYARGGTGISAPGATAGNLRWSGSAFAIDTASYLAAAGTAAAATKLATGRTIGITGDATWTSPAFDGTADVAAALTLASVITAGGPVGSGATVPVITYDAKGRLTAVATEAITPAGIGAATSSHNHTLDSLSNATISSNSAGEILRWNGAAWVNATLAEAGIQPAGPYLTGNQAITLSGIVTGSGATAITTSISDAALSIAKTSGLQTALDAKMATASYPDLVAIEDLAGTSGFLKKTAANTWALDTNTYLTTAGTAAEATKLAAARTLTIGATGKSFDGTANASWSLAEIGALAVSEKGAANGVAPLGADSKIASTYLPSYVDDVLEFASLASFPATGESGKIYVAIDTAKTYRWSGSAYVVISETLALGETSSAAYRGDRGATAYAHSQATGNPHGTTFAQISSKPTTLAGYGITDAQAALGYTPVNKAGDTITGNLTVNGWIESDQGYRDATGVTRISSGGAGTLTTLSTTGLATFAQATVQGVSETEVLVGGVGGRLGGSPALAFASSVLYVGDGVTAGASAILVQAPADNDGVLAFRVGSLSRWSLARVATTQNLDLIARASNGVEIDKPLSVVNASAGTITLGGSTARPVNFTGAIQTAGVTRISAGGAGTLTTLSTTGMADLASARVQSLTASQMVATDGAKNLVSWDAGTARANLGIVRDWGYASGGVPVWIKIIQMRIASQYGTASFSARATDIGVFGAGDYGTLDVAGRIRQSLPMSSPLDYVNLIVSRQGATGITFGYVVDVDNSTEKVVSVYVALTGYRGAIASAIASYGELSFLSGQPLLTSAPAGYAPATWAASTVGSFSAMSVNISGLTASRMLSLDASKNVVSLDAAGSRALIGAQAALGYTPINKAGDTGVGSLIGLNGSNTTWTADTTPTTSGNTNYLSAPIVVQRVATSGTAQAAGIGFHNNGTNAAFLYYDPALSVFRYSRNIGGALVTLWDSGNLTPAAIGAANVVHTHVWSDVSKPTVVSRFSDSAWAGEGGHYGWEYSGADTRFGFSSSGGKVDVYTDGDFYAGDVRNKVWNSGNLPFTVSGNDIVAPGTLITPSSFYVEPASGNQVTAALDNSSILIRKDRGVNVADEFIALSATGILSASLKGSDGSDVSLTVHGNLSITKNFSCVFVSVSGSDTYTLPVSDPVGAIRIINGSVESADNPKIIAPSGSYLRYVLGDGSYTNTTSPVPVWRRHVMVQKTSTDVWWVLGTLA